MRNPPARLTMACGLLALALTLAAGLNGAEHGLGTLVGAGDTPSIVYFSRCGLGTYDLALLGRHRRLSLVLPLGRIDAAGRVVHISVGRATAAINLAPTALRPGDLDRAVTTLLAGLRHLAGGVGEVLRNLMRRVKS